jgi:hypothetical protein
MKMYESVSYVAEASVAAQHGWDAPKSTRPMTANDGKLKHFIRLLLEK